MALRKDGTWTNKKTTATVSATPAPMGAEVTVLRGDPKRPRFFKGTRVKSGLRMSAQIECVDADGNTRWTDTAHLMDL